MIFEIDGSGVRKATVELTDCEIKDAAEVLVELAADIRRKCPLRPDYTYGCVTLKPTQPDANFRGSTKNECRNKRSE